MSSTPAPPPPKPKPAPPAASNGRTFSTRSFGIESGITQKSHKVILYSPGGAGKTSLAASIKQVGINPLFVDLEEGSRFLNVDRVNGIYTWDDLRAVLHDPGMFTKHGAVVIDSLTRAEEMASAWTIANIRNEKGNQVDSIEGYGFGKGTTHLYETFLNLLSDLDSLARSGKHVICTAHDCTATVPNPAGEDFLRWEPRLQSPASGKSSIRYRVREWADHLLFIGFDTFVAKDNKATGAGTRTIYPSELPTHLAKSRSLSQSIAYEKDSAELWRQLLGNVLPTST